ncbi:hypothetical protein CVT26_001487, partial [Gymnopilus dilepis]
MPGTWTFTQPSTQVEEVDTVRTSGLQLSSDGLTEEESLTVVAFNTHFDFKDCFYEQAGDMECVKDPSKMVISLSLSSLMIAYENFSKKDLVKICTMHGVAVGSFTNTNKEVFTLRLKSHRCTFRCQKVVYIFKSRTRPRRVNPSGYSVLKGMIAPDRTVDQNPVQTDTDIPSSRGLFRTMVEKEEDDEFDHLKVLDKETKLDVIREWQSRMDFEKIASCVCAICSSKVRKTEAYTVDGRTIDLTLLRNDELPPIVRPTSYDFIAYDRAILDAEGLVNRNVVANMIVCHPCYSSVRSGSMPKFALCNWLYYGKEALPEDIKIAFAEASMFERMLISRARCNSICCKFQVNSENSRQKKQDGLQRGIRGNIMVAPLDALRLHAILPPKLDQKDTMTAVIVGDKMPTKETISKLGPVLVRKSRIRKLLQFLKDNNPHYSPGEHLSYSQENIDAIHDSDEGADVPNNVAIGHLADYGTIDNINADYTPRNEEEWIPANEVEDLMMENVGYTDGDSSPEAYNAMKILALQRCMSGKPFVVSGTGNRLLPDFNNPRILTWLFPHLDPWGIGGFHESRRKIKIGMREQLCHMLNSSDTSFVRDPELAFA